VVERSAQPQRGDRRSEAPAEMREARDEVRREPEVVAADLPLVLALVQGRVGERLTVGIDELVLSELFLKAGLRGK